MRQKITPAEILLGHGLMLFVAIVWIVSRDVLFAHARVGLGPLAELRQQLSPHFMFMVLGMGLGVVCVLLQAFGTDRLLPLPEGEEQEFRGLSMFTIVLVTLLSGFCEEVFFRGAMQPVLGIWITSLLFGLGHITSWQRALITGFFGLLMGAAALYFGNLWVPIMAHMTNNFIQLCMMRDK
jgi:membrane protease YdiL (CAAX protease family)